MGVIGHIFAGAGLVLLGFGAAVGFVLWIVMRTDAGQLALAVEVKKQEAATVLTAVVSEVAEIKQKVAALWGKRDG